ncbi:MAG: ADP-ribosylglycohydrolase family protein [Phycisphaerae bacterium]
MTKVEKIKGCLVGTAVGDAIGLPREGLSRRRAERMFGNGPLQHAMLLGRGLCSDDTEHTVMVAQALIAARLEPKAFLRDFSRRLRWWFLRIPAGVGFGTLRACMKLWMGCSPDRSGVASAGNGPAMRSAILGLVADSQVNLEDLVHASTSVTHSDSRALEGAMVVASLAQLVATSDGHTLSMDEVSERILPVVNDRQFRSDLNVALDAVEQSQAPDQFSESIGLREGVSGFVVHTVPVAVYCWGNYQGDFRSAIETAVSMGGDSDTVAAIVGAIAGTQGGLDGIPDEWIDDLIEWPCHISWLEALADQLGAVAEGGIASEVPQRPALYKLLRNVLFLMIVLVHGFRRLLPPY